MHSFQILRKKPDDLIRLFYAGESAFTLLELSIVLVVISLIIGGIVAGQSLLQAAALRSVYTNAQTYIDALNSFNDKYGYLPGDFPTATAIWGTESNCPNTASTTALTCNGDGNRHVGDSQTASTWYEYFRAWQQLADAGMIEGHYTGIGYANPIGNTGMNAQPGVNVPKAAKGEGVGYTLWFLDNNTTFTGIYPDAVYNNNFLVYGMSRNAVGASGAPTIGGVLSASQTWAIDRKLDDGYPGTGKIITSRYGNPCVTEGYSTNSLYLITDSTPNACAVFFNTGL